MTGANIFVLKWPTPKLLRQYDQRQKVRAKIDRRKNAGAKMTSAKTLAYILMEYIHPVVSPLEISTMEIKAPHSNSIYRSLWKNTW